MYLSFGHINHTSVVALQESFGCQLQLLFYVLELRRKQTEKLEKERIKAGKTSAWEDEGKEGELGRKERDCVQSRREGLKEKNCAADLG